MKDKILKMIKYIHDLRDSFNYNEVGFGFDRYKPDSKHHYDEAYAIWGLGYLNLFREDINIFPQAILDYIVDYLYDSQRSDGGFGLPWDWKGQNKEISYLITTSFVGLFLIKYNFLLFNKKVSQMISEIQNYILSLKNTVNDRSYLQYSKYFNENIVNAYAVAMALLSLLNYEGYKDLILDLLSNIELGQKENGGFLYSLFPEKEIDIPDNYHQCFILNSLICMKDSLHEDTNNRISRILEKGVKYFIYEFFDDNLSLRRYSKKPLVVINKYEYKKIQILKFVSGIKKKLFFQLPYKPKPLLIDLGQTLLLLSKYIYIYYKHLESVICQVEEALAEIDKNKLEIRGLGHLFHGLTNLLMVKL